MQGDELKFVVVLSLGLYACIVLKLRDDQHSLLEAAPFLKIVKPVT